MVNNMPSSCIKDFVSKGMIAVFRDANDVSNAFFGIGREGCLGLVVVDMFPKMEAEKAAYIDRRTM
jgi:hypothetical protein